MTVSPFVWLGKCRRQLVRKAARLVRMTGPLLCARAEALLVPQARAAPPGSAPPAGHCPAAPAEAALRVRPVGVGPGGWLGAGVASLSPRRGVAGCVEQPVPELGRSRQLIHRDNLPVLAGILPARETNERGVASWHQR